MTIWILISVVGVLIHYNKCLATVEQDTKVFENQTKLIADLLQGYNKLVTPPNPKPLRVRIAFYIFGFFDFNDLNMDFTLSYNMRMTWKDDRLRFKPENYADITLVVLHSELMHKIWRPDIFFINEKGESISKPFSLSNGASRVNYSGDIFFGRKLETTFRCQMKFQNYPFDIQTCYAEIGSFAFTSDIIDIGFMSPPVEFYNKVELTTFELVNVETEQENLTIVSGTYQQVKIIFTLKRLVHFYILQVK